MKAYLAGPLFTMAEREWNVRMKQSLEWYYGLKMWPPQEVKPQDKLKIWLPQENEPRDKSALEIFKMDVKGIDWADMVIAIMDGADPDSGTSWECGYAYAKGKPIVLIRTDYRTNPDGFAPYNLMLTESAYQAVYTPGKDTGEIAKTLFPFIKSVWERMSP